MKLYFAAPLFTAAERDWNAAIAAALRAAGHEVYTLTPNQVKAWKTATAPLQKQWADAVAKGWSRDETIARVNMKERYPVDIGQEYMMDYIQKHNAGILWDKLSTNEE